jgi:hydroxyquinol 1,2-dioxygenase
MAMDGSAGAEASLQDLAHRLGGAGNARLAEGVLIAVGQVHDLITKLRPTPDEFRAVIEFLTDVGHSADARRQEWVLLADVIGVSTLVEDLNAPRVPGATPQTLPGPFYRPDAPEVAEGASISRDGRGEAMVVDGLVTDCDGRGVAGAVVEVWQANGGGFYENQQPDLQPDFNLRGRLRSDAGGMFRFRSVKPKGYALPEDGPVGRLMNRLGLRLERPAHVHFRVTAERFATLTTHVFDRADPAIGRDALFGVKPELLADFVPQAGGGDPGGWKLDVTLILAPHDADAGNRNAD